MRLLKLLHQHCKQTGLAKNVLNPGRCQMVKPVNCNLEAYQCLKIASQLSLQAIQHFALPFAG